VPLTFAARHSLAAWKGDRAVNRLIIELAEELDPDGGEATFARQRQPSVMFGSGSKLSSLQSFLQRPEIRVERCVEGHEDVYFGRPEMRRFALTVEDARSFESPHGANRRRFIAAISRSRQVGSRCLVCKFTDRPPPLQLKYLQIAISCRRFGRQIRANPHRLPSDATPKRPWPARRGGCKIHLVDCVPSTDSPPPGAI
jgi:hypothetical protein